MHFAWRYRVQQHWLTSDVLNGGSCHLTLSDNPCHLEPSADALVPARMSPPDWLLTEPSHALAPVYGTPATTRTGTGPHWPPVTAPVGAIAESVWAGRGQPLGNAVFSHTETWLVLSLVNCSRPQPAQRSRKAIPAMRAIRSSSDGHT